MKGVNPAWANLPRRRCDDCGKNYKPKQPLREGTRGFCSDNCRKSYHKHGGAYRKLKGELERIVRRDYAQRLQMEEPCELCHGKGSVPRGEGRRNPSNLLLPKQPTDTCPKCINGAVLTTFGRDVLDFVQRRSDQLAYNQTMNPVPPQSTAAPVANRSPRA